MATKLPKRSVVIVGGGLTAALVSRQLPVGTDILVLERGGESAADDDDAVLRKFGGH